MSTRSTATEPCRDRRAPKSATRNITNKPVRVRYVTEIGSLSATIDGDKAAPVVPSATASNSNDLDRLVNEIEAISARSDFRAVEAAMRIRELRQRIEAGEAGHGVKWFEWARFKIKLSMSRLYELQAIARAQDPAAELERIRGATRERVRRLREKDAAKERALEPERRKIREWLKTAQSRDVIRIWRQIEPLLAIQKLLERD